MCDGVTYKVNLLIQNSCVNLFPRGWRNRIGRREKWPKKSWKEGEKEKLGVGRIELDGRG